MAEEILRRGHDERLRRLIRDVLQEQIGAHGMTQILLSDADVLINAINASGIAWIAPWDADISWDFRLCDHWASARDAHLAEQADEVP